MVGHEGMSVISGRQTDGRVGGEIASDKVELGTEIHCCYIYTYVSYIGPVSATPGDLIPA